MAYVSRKIFYPLFTVLFLLGFFGLLYMVSFSQSIEIINPSYVISGNDIKLTMTLHNYSWHVVNNIKIVIRNGKEEHTYWLNDGFDLNSKLDANEFYDFVVAIPINEGDNEYFITLASPFNRPINLMLPLTDDLLNPVTPTIYLPRTLPVNKEYTYSVKLCNNSPGDLSEVIWLEIDKMDVFSDVFFERSISIKKGDCKIIYSTLTPKVTGNVQIFFSMRVGPKVKDYNGTISVFEE